MRSPTRLDLVLVAVVGALVFASNPPAQGAPTVGSTPSPSSPTRPTLPKIAPTVEPALSVGGPQLASMGLVLDAAAGVPAPPRLKDAAWVLADLDTGQILAARAAHARLRPASTLKVLTALTLIPQLEAGDTFTATQADADADGTRVGVVAGEKYTGRQLFQGLLLASGNDAAYTLARAGGGMPATLAAMNAVAADLGAHDTVAKDPSGLDAKGQSSSAYDLALIGRAALQLKDFRTYVRTKQVAFPGKTIRAKKGKKARRPSFMIQNHNQLLYHYPGTIGVKNGYTERAHRTFVSAVTRGGKTYLLTEMYSLESSWRPQAALYDWAFAHGDQLSPIGQLVEPGTVTKPPEPAPTATETPAASAAPPVRAAAALPASGPAASDRTVVTATTAAYAAVGAAVVAALLIAFILARARTGAHRGRRRT